MKGLLAASMLFLSIPCFADQFVLSLTGKEIGCGKAFLGKPQAAPVNGLSYKISSDKFEASTGMKLTNLFGSEKFKDNITCMYNEALVLLDQMEQNNQVNTEGNENYEHNEHLVVQPTAGGLALHFMHEHGPVESEAIEAVFLKGNWNDLVENRTVVFKLTERGERQWHDYIYARQSASVDTLIQILSINFNVGDMTPITDQSIETTVQERVIFEGTKNKLEIVGSDLTKWRIELDYNSEQ